MNEEPFFFDDAEIELATEPTLRVASTPETRARYAFLHTKKLASTWEDGRFLYRMGPGGVTVFDTRKWG